MSTEFFNDQWRIPSNENQNKISNYSMNFDGTGYVQIGPPPDNAFLQPSESELNTNGFSVSAWIKIDSSVTTGGIFANDGIPQTGIVYGLEFKINASRTLRIDKGDGTGRFGADIRRVITAETVPVDSWTHVAFVLPFANETTWQIYINGVPSTLSIGGSGGAVGYSSIYSGGIGRFRFSYFVGQIDQVTIFNYALPETGTNSVATLYGGGTAITNPMSLNPKPIYYAQLGDQSVLTGPSSGYLVPNNSLSDYVFNFQSNLDSLIQLAVAPTLTSVVTLSAWIRKFTGIPGSAAILGIRNFPNSPFQAPYRLTCDTSATKLQFSITQTNGVVKTLTSTTTQDINVWYHVMGVADGTNVNLYVNGVPSGTALAYDGTLLAPNAPLFIGSQGTISTLRPFDFNGEISNCAMWDTNLSPTQVESVYNNGAPGDISGLNPLSWWKLNAADTFNSSTGNWTIKDYAGSNNGTSSGMISSNLIVSDLQQTSGYSPYALDLDGINDAIDGNRTIQSNLDFSVSAWVNPISYSIGILGTRELASASTSNGFTMLINSTGNLRGRIFTETSNNFQVQTGSIIPLNNWSHVAMTYNSSSKTLKTYVNGNEAGSVVGVDPSVTSASNLIIGRAAVGFTTYDYFGGKVSNVSIFAAELSSTEIIEIYNSGVPSNLNNLSGTKPTSWWQLGSNSSYLADPNPNPPNVIGRWTCLDEIGTNNAASSNNMTNDAITDGPGYSGSGLGTSTIDIVGDAPYSTANGLSENMDVLDRVSGTGNVPG